MIGELIGVKISKFNKFTLQEIFKHSNAIQLTDVQRQKLELLKKIINEYNSILVLNEEVTLSSSSKAGEYVAQLQKNNVAKEIFTVVLLNSQNKLIHKEEMFEGTINETAVYPREVIKLVLDWDAHSIILTHNHPGGSLTPSQADINLTKALKAALETIGVRLVDHIITNPNAEYKSMAEIGLV